MPHREQVRPDYVPDFRLKWWEEPGGWRWDITDNRTNHLKIAGHELYPTLTAMIDDLNRLPFVWTSIQNNEMRGIPSPLAGTEYSRHPTGQRPRGIY